MAQSIDPFARKKSPVVPAAQSPEKQNELLAKVTGKKPTVLPMPPSAVKLPPGVTGTPPMPAGKVVGHVSPANLTPTERETLEAVGWRPEVELPQTAEGIKALQSAIEAQTVVDLPLGLDPNTPPLKVNTVPLSTLPPERQESIVAAIKNIGLTEKATQEQQRKQAEFEQKAASIKGMAGAVGAVDAAVNAFREKVARAESNAEPVYEMPIGADKTATPVTPVASAEPATSPTGAAAHLTNCPHCMWNLADPDVPEPPYGDKLGFVQCVVGMRPFSKVYQLFNGVIEVTYRTLTTREIDIIYKQTYKDKLEGKLPTELDYWERLNRYRMLLQLQSFRAIGPDGFFKDLPDGYSKSSNPAGTGFWVTEEQEAAFTPDETGIPNIETWIVEEVLKTETVFRMVNNTCNQFNRLVSKMEAMVDNSDFWKPTEVPS